MSDPLILTDQAHQKIWSLIVDEGNLQLKLRIYIQGGGCSGFQYGFSFDEETCDDDTVITKIVNNNAVSVLVDNVSLGYLEGAEIDYKEDIEGDQFIIRNPNAQTTCGCGSSFALKEEEDAEGK